MTAFYANGGGQGRAFPIVIVGHVDHGKSTLVGRLLYDTDSLPDGKIEQLRAVSEKRGSTLEWSFLLDALQIERDQGITVDTTQIWFATRQRRYVIIDAPGHKQFLKNMVTGAASAEAALLVVDAAQGMAEQTRRHAYLLSLMGIAQLAVVVNKVDLIDHDEQRFAALEADIHRFLESLGVTASAVIPISARHGDNIASRSDKLGWYHGPTVLEALDHFRDRPSAIDLPFRLAVQDIYRRGTTRYLLGRVDSGRVRVGDTVLLQPGQTQARIAAIEGWTNPGAPLTTHIAAAAGESVAIRLDEDVFAERGSVLAAPDRPVRVGHELILRVFWLDEQPLRSGDRLSVRIGTGSQSVNVTSLDEIIDPDALDEDRPAPRGAEVGRGGLARITLHGRKPFLADRFTEAPRLGRVTLLRDGHVVGGGVVEAVQAQALTRVDISVSGAERASVNGHHGGVLWLTGLSGAGKSSLAMQSLRDLTDRGWLAHVIDGDNVRLGLNRDLGFSAADRAENVRRVAEVAKMFAEAGMIAIVSLISPRVADRAVARAVIGSGFHEVHVQASLETCRGRDPKGLYRRALSGEIPEFTGVSAPYEAPEQPDLVIDTDQLDPAAAATKLSHYTQHVFAASRAARRNDQR